MRELYYKISECQHKFDVNCTTTYYTLVNKPWGKIKDEEDEEDEEDKMICSAD